MINYRLCRKTAWIWIIFCRRSVLFCVARLWVIWISRPHHHIRRSQCSFVDALDILFVDYSRVEVSRRRKAKNKYCKHSPFPTLRDETEVLELLVPSAKEENDRFYWGFGIKRTSNAAHPLHQSHFQSDGFSRRREITQRAAPWLASPLFLYFYNLIMIIGVHNISMLRVCKVSQ